MDTSTTNSSQLKWFFGHAPKGITALLIVMVVISIAGHIALISVGPRSFDGTAFVALPMLALLIDNNYRPAENRMSQNVVIMIGGLTMIMLITMALSSYALEQKLDKRADLTMKTSQIMRDQQDMLKEQRKLTESLSDQLWIICETARQERHYDITKLCLDVPAP